MIRQLTAGFQGGEQGGPLGRWGGCWEGTGSRIPAALAPVPSMFGKAPEEILESACQKVSLFQNPNDMSGQVRVNYAMLPF